MTDDSRPDDKPKQVSRRLRFEIIRRDGHRCTYCGASADDASLTVDHVIPRALGGTDEPSNLVTACQPCNAGKGSTGPDEHVVEAADERAKVWADALERVARHRREQRSHLDLIIGNFDDAWRQWKAGGERIERDDDWDESIIRFISAGLDSTDLHHYLNVAMRSKARLAGKWKYFCGCCWKEISTRQQMAMASLTEPPNEVLEENLETEPDVEQRIAEAVEAASQTFYNDGFDDGLKHARYSNESGSLAYEDGFRNGSNRVFDKWKRECPDYWYTRPGDADSSTLGENIDEFIARVNDPIPDNEWEG